MAGVLIDEPDDSRGFDSGLLLAGRSTYTMRVCTGAGDGGGAAVVGAGADGFGAAAASACTCFAAAAAACATDDWKYL